MSRIFATILLCFVSLSAFAEHRHHHRHIVARSHINVAEPGSSGLADIMARYLGTNPTHRVSEWCGEMMGLAARALGLRPPAGYALAANWRHFGQPASGPCVGCLMVMRHHVAVVTDVLTGGKVRTISGNHGHRVGYGNYSTSRAIAWRVPL